MKGIILYHLAKHDKVSYDIVVKKSWRFKEKDALKLLNTLNWYYPCSLAYEFCKRYPKYIAVCSEDTDHAHFEINDKIEKTVHDLRHKGFLFLPAIFDGELNQ